MKKHLLRSLKAALPTIFIAFSLAFPAQAVNSVPKILNYQARITDSGGVPVPNGTLSVVFKLYDGDGTCLYSAQGSCGTPTAKTVTVTNGVFTTAIGAAADGDNEIPDGLFDNNVVTLGITVGADAEMTPRKRLTAAAYAFNADRLDDLDVTSSGSTTPYIPSTTTNGNLVITGDPQGSGVGNGSFYVNPANAAANETLLGIASNGSTRFQIDNEGDIAHTGSLLATSASSTAQFLFRGAASQSVNIFEVQDVFTSSVLSVSATGTLIGVDAAGYRVGIGNRAPANAFTVGSGTSTFEVNSAGNLVKVNNVPYSWPASQGGASTVLQNDGSGTLSWATISASTNLNQAYLSSTSTGAYAEISITPSLGALTIADTLSGTGNIFEIQNRTTAAGDYSRRYFTVSSTSTLMGGGATGYLVGIGTASPSVNLDVAGQARFSSTVFPVVDIYRDTTSSGSFLYSGAKLERLMTGQSAQDGSGIAFYFKSRDSGDNSTWAGLFGGGLSTVTDGSEVGFIGFKAAYQDNDPGTSQTYGLKLVARSTLIDDALFNGHVGIGNTAPSNFLTVGSGTSTFEVNSSGNLVKVNNVVYSWPASQGGASTVLQNNGSGTLSWSSTSGLVNLNQAYLSSTSTGTYPEISVTPSLGALTIGDTFSGTGNIFEIQDRTNATGDYSTRYFTVSSTSTNLTYNNVTTGNASTLTVNNLTSGNGLAITNSGTAQTGSLLLAQTASTSSFSNGGVRFNFTGAHLGTGFQIDDVTTGGVGMRLNVNSMTTSGSGLIITANGMTSTTGQALLITSSGAYTAANGMFGIVASGATQGYVARIDANALTSGSALYVNSNASYTGTGVVIVSANTTSGNTAWLNSGALTSGSILSLASSSGSITGTTSTGSMISAVYNASPITASYVGNLAHISYTGTYTTTSTTHSGSLLNVTRTITESGASTQTITGPVAKFTDSLTLTSGTVRHGASVVSITQNYVGATNTALSVVSSASAGAGATIYAKFEPLVVAGYQASPTSNLFSVQNTTLANGVGYTARYFTVSSTSTQVIGGARLIVGATNTLVVNSSGNFETINGVTTRFPSSQGSNGQLLTNDGAGNLTWTTVSAGSTNLNQAYLSSTSTGAYAEISITPSLGALTIADTFSGTGNIFEIQDRTNAAGNYSNRYFTVSSTTTAVTSGTASMPGLSFIGDADTGIYQNLAGAVAFTSNGSTILIVEPTGDVTQFGGGGFYNNGGTIDFGASTGSLADTPTTLTMGAAATSLTIGATTGTTTVRNTLAVGTNIISGTSASIDFTGFDVSSTGTLQINLPLSTGNWAVCHRESNGAATNQTLVDCANTPAADYMEMYPAAAGLEMGDIVMPGTEYVPASNSALVPQVVKTMSSYEGSMIGVVSNPNDATDFNSIGHEIAAQDNPMPVALKGRVRVKVTTENGPIQVGDPITSSSTAGVGMKSTKPGMIVGQALEAWSGSGQGMILVFMGNGFHSGMAITTDGMKSLFADDFAFKPLAVSSASGTSFSSYALNFGASAWDSASNTALTRNISIKNDITSIDEYQLAFRNNSDQLLASLNQAGDLALAGSLTVNGGFDYAETFPATPDLDAGDIVMVDAENANGYGVKKSDAAYENTLLGVISTKPGFLTGKTSPGTQPVALAGRVPVKVNTESGEIKPGDPITSSSAPGVGMKAAEAGRVIGIALQGWNEDGVGMITVFVNPSWWNGPASLAGSAAGSTLTVGSETLVDFKNSTLANVSAIISTSGLWSVTSDGILVAQKVEAIHVQAEQVVLVQSESSATVSEGMVPAGYNAVLVRNPSMKSNAKVFVSFLGDPGGGSWIGEKGEGDFTLHLARPATQDLPFEYWILGVDDRRPDPPIGTDESTPPSSGSSPVHTDTTVSASGTEDTGPAPSGASSSPTEPPATESGTSTSDNN